MVLCKEVHLLTNQLREEFKKKGELDIALTPYAAKRVIDKAEKFIIKYIEDEREDSYKGTIKAFGSWADEIYNRYFEHHLQYDIEEVRK